MAKLVSKVYGEALFETAMANNRIDQVMEEVQTVQRVLKENQELLQFMLHPKILKEEKIKMIEDCFKNRVCDDLTGFLTIVVGKGRFQELPAILDYVISRMKEYKKIGVVHVTTASNMNIFWKIKLEEKLLSTTKYETLEMDYQVDQSLMGGLVIRMGDRVVDSSLKYKLEELKNQLLKISLEKEKEGEKAS